MRVPPLEQLDALLRGVLDRVRKHTGAQRVALFLRDPHTDELVARRWRGGALSEVRIPPGEGTAGAALRDNITRCWPEDGEPPHPRAQELTGTQPHAVLAVPLRMGGAPVGVLELVDGDICQGRARGCAESNARSLERLLGASSLAAQLVPRGELRVALRFRYEGVVGASPAMQKALDLASRVAATDASVLVTGETGTGKDLFARAIHANSTRRRGPLVKVDCGSIPDTLVEAELFGHQRGAFTGAVGSRSGVFEQAHEGTVFLDEIGELSPMAQTRLLRVLEERVVRRVGGAEVRKVDFRLVSATHRDLSAMAVEGQFRPDLLHRLQVVRIHLPSLRERGKDDILRLVEHFARLHGKRHCRPVRAIPSSTQEMLSAYLWPGNVRELSHALESAVVVSPDGVLDPSLFHLQDPLGLGPFEDEPTLAELEKRYLSWLLSHYQGSRSEVARVAGIGRTTLWRRMREVGLEV